MRDDGERLLDIKEAIERIEKYSVRGREEFETNELIQIWILHHLQIIGEAARAVSDRFAEKHTKIAWSSIIGMRNILVHHYFGIDKPTVWTVVERDLPLLKEQIANLIRQFNQNPN